MILLLTTIYILSIGLAVSIVSWESFNSKESPFIIALKSYDLPFIPHIFNGALIIAGFSTMAAALFGVTSVLVTLAEDGDAPAFFAKKGRLKIPLPTLGLTVAGLVASIVMALVMPGKIYEYITTGAGLMLLYNWFFILLSARRLLHPSTFDHVKYFSGMILIFLAVTGTIVSNSSRPGFFISLGFVVVIALVALKMRKSWKNQDGSSDQNPSLFNKGSFEDAKMESVFVNKKKE